MTQLDPQDVATAIAKAVLGGIISDDQTAFFSQAAIIGNRWDHVAHAIIRGITDQNGQTYILVDKTLLVKLCDAVEGDYGWDMMQQTDMQERMCALRAQLRQKGEDAQ
jgi:hypothetical protein